MSPGSPTSSLLRSSAQTPGCPRQSGPYLSSACLITLAIVLVYLLDISYPLQLHSPADYLLLIAAATSAIVLHEAGHLLAAVCCRFHIQTLSLGPFRLVRAGSGWRLQFIWRRVFAGSVAAFPQTNEFWRERMLTVVAAGPAATFVSALLALSVLHWQPQCGALISAFLQISIQINFVIFVLGLIPNSSAVRLRNDAALFLLLWRGGTEADEIFLYHLVLQHQRSDVSPRNYPLWLIELIATFQGRPEFMVFYAGVIASWAFDRKSQASGHESIERHIDARNADQIAWVEAYAAATPVLAR